VPRLPQVPRVQRSPAAERKMMAHARRSAFARASRLPSRASSDAAGGLGLSGRRVPLPDQPTCQSLGKSSELEDDILYRFTKYTDDYCIDLPKPALPSSHHPHARRQPSSPASQPTSPPGTLSSINLYVPLPAPTSEPTIQFPHTPTLTFLTLSPALPVVVPSRLWPWLSFSHTHLNAHAP